MNEHYAYAQGISQKLAEYGITPEQFINAATQSGDRTAIKVANALVRVAPRRAYTAEALYGSHPWKEGPNFFQRNALPLALGGAGVLAGGAGLAYGMGDADTYGNQARNMANDYLGTDFDTQSRLGYGMEQLQNRFG